MQTSYIKMIDIWLLFGLVLPFFAFTLSILEELVVQKMEDDNEKLSQVGDDIFYQHKHNKHHHHHCDQQHHQHHGDQHEHQHHHGDHHHHHHHHRHQADQQSSHNQDRRISKISPLPRTVINKRSPRSAQAVIHLLGRRMLPIITAAFCTLYCLVAAFLYFFPSLQYGL